jgi:type 1 glutamine amidotransferase
MKMMQMLGTVALLGTLVGPAVAAPKKVLVVTTTTGFRHSSIPTAEKVIGEIAARTGIFTVDYARVETGSPEFKGADGKPDKNRIKEAVAKELGPKMTAEALKQYDAVIFANTTGDLPLPDREAFMSWIRSGKGFVGMHAATDTFPNYAPYIDMIGGKFAGHGPQAGVEVINQDKGCPACAHLPGKWSVFDEIYLLKDFDARKVHGLLTLDSHPNNKTPGNFQIAWAKSYGKGRVFYTSLGHREDIWDANTPENFQRKNSREVAELYQKHILGGIRWALGLEDWQAKTGAIE